MDKKHILSLVLVVLVLIYFLNHMTTTTTTIIPTTTGMSVNKYNYRQPVTTSYVSGNYNPYKAQYYN